MAHGIDKETGGLDEGKDMEKADEGQKRNERYEETVRDRLARTLDESSLKQANLKQATTDALTEVFNEKSSSDIILQQLRKNREKDFKKIKNDDEHPDRQNKTENMDYYYQGSGGGTSIADQIQMAEELKNLLLELETNLDAVFHDYVRKVQGVASQGVMQETMTKYFAENMGKTHKDIDNAITRLQQEDIPFINKWIDKLQNLHM